jgi:glycosyltransferase involved in cell wall biosynthesis
MHTPKVTFVVPCYKLAHLLADCVNSLLAQTYRDFEVLIMDDCSPDHTAEIARSFQDPRVQHIRNEPNLGHLRNYNKGFALARGEYIWLISADDRLRTSNVLERYLEVMEANPGVGFAFCPGIALQDDEETGIVKWATLAEPDTILDGRTFLRRLLQSNCVLAPAGLVRRQCYDRVGVFPVDLPFAGDWFLWCAIALHYDVAYFAEPMVNYREHSLSMTDTLIADDIRKLSRDDFEVRWRMKENIEKVGDDGLAHHCTSTIVEDYIQSLTGKTWRGTKFRMSVAEFDRSLAMHASGQEREDLRKRVLAGIGRHLTWDRDLVPELQLYRLAVEHGGANPKLWVQYAMLRLGRFGLLIIDIASAVRALARRRHARGAR